MSSRPVVLWIENSGRWFADYISRVYGINELELHRNCARRIRIQNEVCAQLTLSSEVSFIRGRRTFYDPLSVSMLGVEQVAELRVENRASSVGARVVHLYHVTGSALCS